jgi:hypothetical protein
MSKLRISHVTVQAVLVWDDGEELSPGPEVKPVTLPLSQVPHFAQVLPAEVAQVAEQLNAQPESDPK